VVTQLKRREEEAVALWQETGFDVLVHVLGFLRDERDVGRCALVSRAWREAADSQVLWRRIVARLSRELGLDLVARYAAKRESESEDVDKNENENERERESEEAEVVDYKRLYVEYVRELQASAGHLKDMHEAQDFYLNQVHLPPLGSSYTSLKIVTVGSGAVPRCDTTHTTRIDTTRHDTTRHDTTRHDTTRHTTHRLTMMRGARWGRRRCW
jgi:hypothetical protein